MELSPDRRRRTRTWLGRALLSFVALVAALLLAELLLRIVCRDASFRAARELVQFRASPTWADRYTVDPEMGFRPVLDTGLYSAYGALRNDYPAEKRASLTRVLFVGDSVTARATIVDSLHQLYGEDGFEYWNAGVDSFNTIQEVAFYQRYNRALKPDHVVLTFHMNDFETTPVVFIEHGHLVVYAPNMPVREVQAGLFKASRLYRLLLGALSQSDASIDRVVRETTDALHRLQVMVADDHARLSVIVLPFLRPLDTWSAGDHMTHRLAIEALTRMGIRHFDMLPVVQAALREGIVASEATGDDWHPSVAMGQRIAAALHDAGLLQEPPTEQLR